MLRRSSSTSGPSTFFKVWSESECKGFAKVPTVERVFPPPTTVDQVVATLMEADFLNMSDKHGDSVVRDRSRGDDGVTTFVREVRTSVGPVSVRMRLFTTQWADRRDPRRVVVFSHAFDETEKCHLVANFVVALDTDTVSVRVSYEELTSSPALAVKLGTGKIRKAHDAVLTSLAARVLLRPRPRPPDLAPAELEQEIVSDESLVLDAPDDSMLMEQPDLRNASAMFEFEMVQLTNVESSPKHQPLSVSPRSQTRAAPRSPAPSSPAPRPGASPRGSRVDLSMTHPPPSSSSRLAKEKLANEKSANERSSKREQYLSQERRLKLVQPKFVTGSFVLALNAESETWKEARVLRFDQGLYEVKFAADSSMQCCDEAEIRPRDASARRPSASEDDSGGGGSLEVSPRMVIGASRGSARRADDDSPVSSLRSSARGRIEASPPLPSPRTRVAQQKTVGDEMEPPKEAAPARPAPRNVVTWQISAIEEVSTLFDDTTDDADGF